MMRRALLVLAGCSVALSGCGSTPSRPVATPPREQAPSSQALQSATQVEVQTPWSPITLPDGAKIQVEAVTINGMCFVVSANGMLHSLTLAESGGGGLEHSSAC